MEDTTYMHLNTWAARQPRGLRKDHYMQGQAQRQENRNHNRKPPKYLEELHWRIRLCQELRETRRQLAKEKSLKEIYKKKEKETRQELERLQKYSSAETLHATKTADILVSKTTKRKNSDLYKNCKISVDNLKSELQQEKEKNIDLQKQLDTLFLPIYAKYPEVMLHANDLQDDIGEVDVADADILARNLQLVQNLRSSKEIQYQKMEEELKSKRERNKCFQEDMEGLRASYQRILTISEPADRLESEPEEQAMSDAEPNPTLENEAGSSPLV